MKSFVKKFNYQKKDEDQAEAREIFVMAESDMAIAGYDRARVTDEKMWNRIQEVFKDHDVNPEMPTRKEKVDESQMTALDKEIKSFGIGWRRFNKDRITG